MSTRSSLKILDHGTMALLRERIQALKTFENSKSKTLQKISVYVYTGKFIKTNKFQNKMTWLEISVRLTLYY